MSEDIALVILYTPDQARLLDNTFIVVNSLSAFFGTLTIIILLSFKKESQNSSSLFFSLVTTLAHLSFLIGPLSGPMLQTSPLLCTVQGTLLQFTNLSGACWFLWISLQLYLVVVWDHSYDKINRSLILPFHGFAWGFPTIMTVLQLSWPGMTFRIYWCWVKPINFGIWEWACFYGPIFVLLTLVAFFWCISIYKVSRYITQFKTRAYLTQSMIGVFTIFLSYALQATHRIYILHYPNSFGFQMAHTVASGCMGMLAFFVFGVTPHNVKACWQLTKRWRNRKEYTLLNGQEIYEQ